MIRSNRFARIALRIHPATKGQSFQTEGHLSLLFFCLSKPQMTSYVLTSGTDRKAPTGNSISANKGLPLPLGRGACETKSKNGRSRPRKPFLSRVLCAQRGIETMVSDHGLGRGPDHGVGVDPEIVSMCILESDLITGFVAGNRGVPCLLYSQALSTQKPPDFVMAFSYGSFLQNPPGALSKVCFCVFL